LGWVKQLSETGYCVVIKISNAAAAAAAAAAAGVSCSLLPFQQASVLGVVTMAADAGATANAAGRDGARFSRHMLQFKVDCLSVLPDSCSYTITDAATSATFITQQQLQQQMSGYARSAAQKSARFSLVSSRQVLAALLSSCGPLLPVAVDVPKPQLLHGLEAVWAGLAAAVQHLKQQGHLPASCCIDMRHFKRSLQQLVAILSEHIAQQDTNKFLMQQAAVSAAAADASAAEAASATPIAEQAAAECAYGVTPQTPVGAKSPYASSRAAQKSTGSIWNNIPAGTPKAPTAPKTPAAGACFAAAHVPLTPGAAAATAAASLPSSPSAWRLSQTAPGTPMAAAAVAAAAGVGSGIGGRKVPLKTMCCVVLEVLCRSVCLSCVCAVRCCNMLHVCKLLLTCQ
jgi:hypothetical protein